MIEELGIGPSGIQRLREAVELGDSVIIDGRNVSVERAKGVLEFFDSLPEHRRVKFCELGIRQAITASERQPLGGHVRGDVKKKLAQEGSLC